MKCECINWGYSPDMGNRIEGHHPHCSRVERTILGPRIVHDLTLDRIMYCVQAELAHARAKFPDNKTNFTALVEEVGELAEALLKKQSANVFAEAVQVITMAIRCVQEPDEVHNVTLSYEDYKVFPVNKRLP